MNVLFWNIRGIGNEPSQNMLKQHVISFRPLWVAIAEPKVTFDSIPSSYWTALGLRLVGYHVATGFLPNIWILENVSLQPSTVLFTSPQMLTLQVSFLHHTFLLSFVHASNDYLVRRTLWDDILALPSIPSMVVGDFNSVLGAHERSNGTPPVQHEVYDFTAFLHASELIESASSGAFFTWSNRRFTGGYLETRIDRTLITNSFLDLWDSVTSHVGMRNCSDHSPLLISCRTGQLALPRPFRFQNMWISHFSFEEVVRQSWSAPVSATSTFGMVQAKLKRLKCRLKAWNLMVFGNIRTRLAQAQQRVTSIQADLASHSPMHNIQNLEWEALADYNLILDQEATFLRQKARDDWLRDGDRNSAFFHRKLKISKGQGSITSLLIDGVVISDRQTIRDHILHYYEELFARDPDHLPSFEGLDTLFPNSVTPQQNEELIRVPSPDDVRHTVFGMSPDSAPGPDGFNGKFYQSMWHIVGPDVISAIRTFFIHGHFPAGLNASFVTLIPKFKDAIRIEDFRPIVLGNFLYKIVTKILSERLGPILADLLSFHQFGFVPGRRIHDCIALASEGVNSLNIRHLDGNIALKVDIKKAFDTVSWDFLLEALRHLGFSSTFIDWITFILHSAHLSVLINGAPEGYFPCSQGVRQGDPLSPLLFCIAEEALSCLLTHSTSTGMLSPLFIGRDISFPSHLLYADDVIIFCRATFSNCREILHILNRYKNWSGQHFNPDKSRVYFSTSIPATRSRRMSRILGITIGSLPFVYLGVPLFIGAPRTRYLQTIADSILARFARWKGSSLSMAGRICLVQSVIQGAFVHSMMIYRWPLTLLKKLESRIRNFVFTGDILKRSSICVSWKRCCVPKSEGGLGLRSLVVANRAYLSRLCWDIMNRREPYMEVFLSRFFTHEQIRRYVQSTVWFGFKDCYPALLHNSRWLVGSDSHIRFWLDNWLGYCIADRVGIPLHLRHHFDFHIADYVVDGDWDILPEFYAAYPDVARDIAHYTLAPPRSDTRIWIPSSNGAASSAVFYEHFRYDLPVVSWGDWIWASFIPPRRSVTLWRAIHDKLPTMDHLRNIGFTGPSFCIFCRASSESIDHIFALCPFILDIWSRILDIFHIQMPHVSSLNEWLIFAMSRSFSTQVGAIWRLAFVTLIWLIWHTRNKWIFEDVPFTQHSIIFAFQSFIREQRSLLKGTMYNTQEDLFTLHSLGIRGHSRGGLSIVEVRWHPPSWGWIKCNTDGSAMGSPGDAKGAGVFRNHLGHVLCCFVTNLGRAFAFEAELIAAMTGVELACQQGWYRLWLETDSTYVEGLLCSRSTIVPWSLRNRWLRVLDLLSTLEFKVSHIYREGNGVADTLSNHPFEGVWFHQLDIIASQVARDVSGQPYHRISQL